MHDPGTTPFRHAGAVLAGAASTVIGGSQLASMIASAAASLGPASRGPLLWPPQATSATIRKPRVTIATQYKRGDSASKRLPGGRRRHRWDGGP